MTVYSEYTVANPTSFRNVTSHWLTLGFTSPKVQAVGADWYALQGEGFAQVLL